METCHFFQVPPAQRQQLTWMAAEPCGSSAWWLGTKHSHVPMRSRFIPVWLELWQSLLLHVWSIFHCGVPGTSLASHIYALSWYGLHADALLKAVRERLLSRTVFQSVWSAGCETSFGWNRGFSLSGQLHFFSWALCHWKCFICLLFAAVVPLIWFWVDRARSEVPG